MVMKYKDIQTMLGKLEDRGKVSTGDLMMYFVSPFLKGLGYDIFDIDTVDIQQDKGKARVKVLEDLQMVVSLEEGNYGDESEDRIYVRINVDAREMELYFKVLDKWETIVQLSLAGDEDDKYVEVTKKIAKDQIKMEYEKKGERFLSEIVLDYQLENGVWENDFLKNSILKEIEQPTEEFKKLFATRLQEEYTTRDVEWIQSKLEGLTGQGVMNLVVKALYETGVINGLELEDDEQEEDVSKEENAEVKEEEEPTTVGDNKDKSLDSIEEQLGFGEPSKDNLKTLEDTEESEEKREGFETKGEENVTDDIQEKEEGQEGSVDLGGLVSGIGIGGERKDEKDKKEDEEVLVEVVESIEEDKEKENSPRSLTDITDMFNFGDEEDGTKESGKGDIFTDELILDEGSNKQEKKNDKKESRFGGYKTSNRFY